MFGKPAGWRNPILCQYLHGSVSKSTKVFIICGASAIVGSVAFQLRRGKRKKSRPCCLSPAYEASLGRHHGSR